MRFGNFSGLSSIPSRLGLSAESNMLQTAQGVGSSVDAYLRTLAAMHHMVYENSQGKDVTPAEYGQVLKNALAAESSAILSEVVLPKPLLSFYVVQSSDLTLNLTYDQGVVVFLTLVQNSKRFWIALKRTSEDNGAQVYEPISVAYHPCHPDERIGFLTYPTSGPSASDIIGSTNSGCTCVFTTDMGTCGVTAFIKESHFVVMSFNVSNGQYVERQYNFVSFPDSDARFLAVENSTYLLEPTFVGFWDTGHGGSQQTTWAVGSNGVWTSGSGLAPWGFVVPVEVLTLYPSLDKAMITVLAADARIGLASD